MEPLGTNFDTAINSLQFFSGLSGAKGLTAGGDFHSTMMGGSSLVSSLQGLHRQFGGEGKAQAILHTPGMDFNEKLDRMQQLAQDDPASVVADRIRNGLIRAGNVITSTDYDVSSVQSIMAPKGLGDKLAGALDISDIIKNLDLKKIGKLSFTDVTLDNLDDIKMPAPSTLKTILKGFNK